MLETQPKLLAEQETKLALLKMQGQAGFGRLWQYNRQEWPHGLMGCVGSFGLGFMMPGMAYCMSSIIAVLYNPDPAQIQSQVCPLFPMCLKLTHLADLHRRALAHVQTSSIDELPCQNSITAS